MSSYPHAGSHSNCTSLPLTHGEMVRLDEGRFPALELNNRRLSVKNSFCRKNGIYTRSVGFSRKYEQPSRSTVAVRLFVSGPVLMCVWIPTVCQRALGEATRLSSAFPSTSLASLLGVQARMLNALLLVSSSSSSSVCQYWSTCQDCRSPAAETSPHPLRSLAFDGHVK